MTELRPQEAGGLAGRSLSSTGAKLSGPLEGLGKQGPKPWESLEWAQ